MRDCSLLAVPFALMVGSLASAGEPSIRELEEQFRTLPMDARRLTGPLFWLHGDARETKEHLEMYLEKVAEGGNGCFTAESRPHSDWLGPRWYRDLGICLEKAKQLNLKMWIFDEKWWPSQAVAGKVPPQYGSKRLEATATAVTGPKRVEEKDFGGPNFVGAVAGKEVQGGIDGEGLIDLAGFIKDGTLAWDAPAGDWKVMKFTWKRSHALADGASQESVDWFIRTVYQPHYDRFKDDFGKTIVGYFYDEPETRGDWGTEVMKLLAEMKVDWKKALVSWKFRLAGEEQTAARYAYHEAFAEAWGRTMYGGMTRWCHEHNVLSIGHFLEHSLCYLNMELCAGNLFQLMKYSDMGAIDAVFSQFRMGQRVAGDPPTWQTPRLASSISHVYAKRDDVAMVEIFGARGQDLTYPEMRWWTDHMQVSGVNFMIPHSFNPRAPYDGDCPPYFYNGGFEPRYPLYRVYADYTSRLSLMLSGGRHVCPVAFLFLGNSSHVGKFVPPEEMSSALQDALFDCDWMPYEVFERDTALAGKEIKLYGERYKILFVPPVEVIPYATLAKAKAFFDGGGTVVAYGFLPTRSATLGKTAADIVALTEAIWGKPSPGLKASRTHDAGGRSYLLPEKFAPEDIQKALTEDAGIHATLEVVRGKTNHWLHVLHRVKAGRDVFLVCNQDAKSEAREFRLRVTAAGEPECWDAMRNEITAVPSQRTGDSVEIDLTLGALDSALLVFQPQKRVLPMRLTAADKPVGEPIPLVREATPPPKEAGVVPPKEEKKDDPKVLDASWWVWYPEGNPAASAPPGTRYFRKLLSLPADAKIQRATFHITCDNDFVLFVNGEKAGESDGGEDNWRQLEKIDVTRLLRAGENLLAIQAVNATEKASPAGLIGCLTVESPQGKPLEVRTDKTWKAAKQEAKGWEKPGFDDTAWVAAKELVRFGGAPWGRLGGGGGGGMTLSPVKADPFLGRCEIPASVDLAKVRVVLEMAEIAPEEAARVTVNGAYAGGMICKPFRLDVTKHVKPGANTIEIVPFAPKSARLAIYPR